MGGDKIPILALPVQGKLRLHNISLIVNPMFEKIRNSQFILNYRRMWPYVKPYWFRALLAMSLCIPIGSLDAVIALSLKPYMDMVLIEKSTGSSAWYAPLFIIGFTICQGGLTYLATYLNVWVGSHITNDLKMSLYNKLLTFETSFFDRQNSGDVVFRFNNDADLACAGLLSNLRLFLSRLFSSLSLIGVLFYNSWATVGYCHGCTRMHFLSDDQSKKHDQSPDETDSCHPDPKRLRHTMKRLPETGPSWLITISRNKRKNSGKSLRRCSSSASK